MAAKFIFSLLIIGHFGKSISAESTDSCGVLLEQHQRQVLRNWTLPFKFFMEGRYNDFAYILVLEPKLSFMNSVMACSARASVLTDVEDAAELTFIRSLVEKANYGGNVWLGGLYLQSDFRWIRTNSVITTFAPGEPNKKRDGWDESCVFLHTNRIVGIDRIVADKYCLHDDIIPSDLPFICKQPIY